MTLWSAVNQVTFGGGQASWGEEVTWIVVALAAYAVIAAATRHPRFVKRNVGRATPGTLGAIRALTCGILLVNTLWEDLPSSALLPRDMIHHPGILVILNALPGFDSFLTSEGALAALQAATATLLLLGLLGAGTRVVLPLAALAYLVQGGVLRQYAWFYHTGLVPLYVLVVLCLTPSGDGLSVDRLVRARRGEAVPPRDRPRLLYGWSRYACWVAIALPYLGAGLSKLRRVGLLWFHADNMKAILLTDSLNPMQFDWGVGLKLVHAPDLIFTLLAAAAVAGEVTFVLVLFSCRARRVLPALMAAMHLGIWLLQNVLFVDLVLLQLAFYDLSFVGRPLTHASPTSRSAVAASTTIPSCDWQRWPRRVRCIAAVLLLCWAARLELYPFTAMQMYTSLNSTGVIEYYRVLALDESGHSFRAPLEAAIPAVQDARYRRIIRRAFEKPSQRAVVEQFLDVCGRRLNTSAAPGEFVVRFEVQKRRWDYKAHPDDPERGEVVDAFVHEMSR